MNKMGILTSGGDSPGMNAAIRAVVYFSYQYNLEYIGIINGYKGLIEGNTLKLNKKNVINIIQNSGTILKTSRSKHFETIEGKKKAYKMIKQNNLNGLIVIGGNGSLIGAIKFVNRLLDIPIVVIPGTIDNDIYGTDLTIGYDTALNTIIDAIDKIKNTALSHNRLFIIEVMGRYSGYLAINSGIATDSIAIIPGMNYNLDYLIKYIKCKKKSTIIVTEGSKLGIHELAKITRCKFKDYEIRVFILGHIQRCGNPSCFDRVLATKLGCESVKTLSILKTNVVIGIKNNNIVINTF
jgi:6-phosphofructokinase 1